MDLRQYCELHSKFCDKQTLLVDLRKIIFKYTLNETGGLSEFDLESPRVKTGSLKPIFCLAYFTMTYVTLQEQIMEQLKELEQFVQRYESELEQPSPEKSQRLSCSPDVNRLDIANIAINTTIDQQNTPLESSQATALIAAPAELAEYAMLSAASYPGSTSQSRASVVRCTPEAVSPSAAASAGPNKSSAESAMTSAFLNQVA